MSERPALEKSATGPLGLDAAKRTLRQQMRGLRQGLSPQMRASASAAICRQVLAHPAFERARTVHLYLSLPEEVQTAALVQACHRSGRTVVVPIQQPQTRTLAWCRLGPETPLAPGPFGVPEPPPHARTEAPTDAGVLAQVELVLVPGLAFDFRGNRLGYGQGYYDGFLATLAQARSAAGLPPATRLGLCLGAQVLPQVPHGPRDLPMYGLITETQTLDFLPET